jgi:hypothetical protein
MHGFPILPWLALVAVYLATGRARGSSWRSLATVAAAVLAVVFLEFTLAFALGLVGLLATALVAVALFSGISLGRRSASGSGGTTALRAPAERLRDGAT